MSQSAATATGSEPPITKPKKRPLGIAVMPGSAPSINSAITWSSSLPSAGSGPPSASRTSSADALGRTGRSPSVARKRAA